MKAVGTKVLKDNLSKYLKMVREGETILVLDRETVIAEIHRPTLPLEGKMDRWTRFYNEQVRNGGIIPAKKGPAPSLSELFEFPRPDPPIDLQTLLDEIRGDR